MPQIKEYIKPELAQGWRNLEEEYNEILNEKVNISDGINANEIIKLKSIASCASILIKPELRIKLIKEIVKYSENDVDENEEDLILDLIKTSIGPIDSQTKKFADFLFNDAELCDILFNTFENKNPLDVFGIYPEDNKSRLIYELYRLWQKSDFRTATYSYNETSPELFSRNISINGYFSTHRYNIQLSDGIVRAAVSIDNGNYVFQDLSEINYYYELFKPIKIVSINNDNEILITNEHVPAFCLFDIDYLISKGVLNKEHDIIFTEIDDIANSAIIEYKNYYKLDEVPPLIRYKIHQEVFISWINYNFKPDETSINVQYLGVLNTPLPYYPNVYVLVRGLIADGDDDALDRTQLLAVTGISWSGSKSITQLKSIEDLIKLLPLNYPSAVGDIKYRVFSNKFRGFIDMRRYYYDYSVPENRIITLADILLDENYIAEDITIIEEKSIQLGLPSGFFVEFWDHVAYNDHPYKARGFRIGYQSTGDIPNLGVTVVTPFIVICSECVNQSIQLIEKL